MRARRKKLLTLCIVRDDDRVLLGFKKRGFGQGYWNGFGGKVQVGESIENAARRELNEEAAIDALTCEFYGVLRFNFENMSDTLEVRVFRVAAWRGEPQETDEMNPQWFALDEIPYDSMWPDDRYWLPLLLSGKKFSGHFIFTQDAVLLRHTVQELTAQIITAD